METQMLGPPWAPQRGDSDPDPAMFPQLLRGHWQKGNIKSHYAGRKLNFQQEFSELFLCATDCASTAGTHE